MRSFISFLLLAAVFLHQTSLIQSDCVNLSDPTGIITGIYDGVRTQLYHKCWNILNPNNLLLRIEKKHLNLESWTCLYANVSITLNTTGERVKYCTAYHEKEPISVYSSVTIDFFAVPNTLNANGNKNFEFHYSRDDSIKGVEGVKEAHTRAVSWMKSNWTSWKWSNHIPKAITALALDVGDYFNHKNVNHTRMLNQRELQMSVSLVRDTQSSERLSTFINSLLTTCNNPRNFYGHNLVELLKEQMALESFTHPASYLALCNANETWPDKAYHDLIKIFNSTLYIPFKRDYQSFAVMALSCKLRRTGNHSIPNMKLLQYYEETIKELKSLQNPSGTFGNMHRTALITQVLVASGHKQDTDWNVYKAAKSLKNLMNLFPTDFLSTYLIIPLFGEKSIADIAFISCSSYRDKVELVDEIHHYLTPKANIQIQYSLFMGNARDVIRAVILEVPKNYTAFDVMLLAASKDKNFRFTFESESGKREIYEIIDIPNDPEDGMFWIFLLKKAGPENSFRHVAMGPDQTTLNDGDHIAMWYTKGHTMKEVHE